VVDVAQAQLGAFRVAQTLLRDVAALGGHRVGVEPEAVREGLDRLHERRRARRLGEEQLGAARDGLLLGRVEGGADDDRRRLAAQDLAQPVDELEAVHVGHADVGQDDVGALGAREADGGLGRQRRRDAVARHLEDLPVRLDEVGVVVHDEDARAVLRTRGLAPRDTVSHRGNMVLRLAPASQETPRPRARCGLAVFAAARAAALCSRVCRLTLFADGGSDGARHRREEPAARSAHGRRAVAQVGTVPQ
jgi:hypothetical protein